MMSRSPRRIIIGEVATQEVEATISILPGDAVSDLLMFLAIVWILDTVKSRWTQSAGQCLMLVVVADDIQLLMVGRRADVYRDFSDAVAFLVGELNAVGLPVAVWENFFYRQTKQILWS